MRYYLHTESGVVASLGDDEAATASQLGDHPEMFVEVHLHPNAVDEPSRTRLLTAKVLSFLLASGLVAIVAGVAAWVWKAALG
jgi:hypothetical protein